MATSQPPEWGKRPIVLLVTVRVSSQAHAKQVIAELRAHPDVVRVTVMNRPKERS